MLLIDYAIGGLALLLFGPAACCCARAGASG